jgi:hypothetical protein
MQEVERLAQRGWRLLPCAVRGKAPLLKGWPALASSDLAALRSWAAEYPGCNWGVATGPGSRVFVLDVDGEAGRASLAALEAEHGLLPSTLTSKTGRADGGEHRWFKYPAACEIRGSAGKLAEGLDIRATGGYVIVPPSIHETGRAYQWADSKQPTADAPSWLLDLASGEARKDRNPLAARIDILVKGERNDGLTRYAGWLRRKGAELPELEEKLFAANARRCQPPMEETEVRRIAASNARYQAGGPDPLETAWAAVLKETRPRGYEQFIAIARNLQLARPGLSIALPLERIGDLMGCDWTQARRWRKRAVREGSLRLTEHYIRHKRAALYVFNEIPRLGVPLLAECTTMPECPTILPTIGLAGQREKRSL